VAAGTNEAESGSSCEPVRAFPSEIGDGFN
jgi:hypothetical protein